MTDPREAATESARSFEEAWAEKEADGYRYGTDALEQVRFGWEIAFEHLTRTNPLDAQANAAGFESGADWVAAMQGALKAADETFEQVLDDMRDGGKCVCGAVKDEIIETHGVVRTTLGDPR